MKSYGDNSRWAEQKLKNRLHTLILLAGILMLSSLTGWFLAGTAGMVWVLAVTAVSVAAFPRLTPHWALRRFGARALDPRYAPSLFANLRELTRRAGLSTVPTLVYLPTRNLTAFTTGTRDDAVIAVSEGLLRALDNRELTGVMAHEISHLKNNDLWIMNVSATFNQITSILSAVGQIMLIFNLPLVVLTEHHFPWIGVLVLIFAPTLTMLLQLALSRTREFDADLMAARLTGDSRGLASALFTIERYRRGWLGRLRWMGHGSPYDTIWRTHPPTRARIRRLMAVADRSPMFGWRPVGVNRA